MEGIKSIHTTARPISQFRFRMILWTATVYVFQIKRERVLAMRRQKEKRQEWIKNGHGEYEEIPEEKDFFEISKKSENVVCHFYTDGNERCKAGIIDDLQLF